MLETLRAASKSWVAAILIGMLILSFAIWGINDIFSRSSSRWLARVGGVEIDARTFESELQQRIRRQTGPDGRPMTIAMARELGYDRMVLDGMISDIAMLQAAERMKLGASDDMVRAEIAAIPGLARADGSIDQAVLQRGLDQMGMSEAQFVQAQREDLMRRQLLESAVLGVPAPKTLTTALTAYVNERRVVEYVVLPPEKAGEIAAPDDAALQAYVEANPAAYTAPELRGITLMSVRPEDLMPGITIADDAVKAEYEATKATYETAETRDLQQIPFASKEEAEAARKEIDGGKSFEEIATARKLTPEDIALGTITKGDSTVPPGAFEIAEGEVSQPLEGPFGWVLIKAVKVTPGTTKSFDEVREEIRTKLARNQAIDQILNAQNDIEDALAATDTLDGAADALKDKLKFTVTKIPAIDASGNDADGKPIEGLPDGPAFLRDVFALEQGDKSDLADTPNHVLYVIQLDSVTPPALRKLADIRDEAAAAWLQAEQIKRLTALADETTKAANAGGQSIEDVAKALGLEAKTSGEIARDATDDGFSPTLVKALYDAPKGQWVSGPGAPPTIAIARVKEITAQKVDDLAMQERDIRGMETRSMASDLAETLRKAIVAAADVEIDEAQFQDLRKRGQ